MKDQGRNSKKVVGAKDDWRKKCQLKSDFSNL